MPGLEDVTADLVRRAIDAAPVGVTITDPHRPDNPIVYANGAFAEITGYDVEHALGRNCRFLQGPDTDPAAVDVLREAVAARESATVELLNYRADGTPFYNEVTIAPLRDGEGDVTHFVGFQADVTARKEAQRALEERTTNLEHLVDRVDGLLGDVTDELMHATTPAAGRRAAVERIADTEPYVFAWYGERDRPSDTVVPTAWAGAGDPLDGVAIDLGAADPTARAHAERTVRTAPVGETACASLVPGASVVAATPVAYGEATYGVLTVYADQDDAFAGRETAVVRALGRTMGAAVNAAESQRALVADTVTEVELAVTDDAFFLAALAEACDCRLTYRGSAAPDGEALSLFVAVDGDPEAVVTAASSVSTVDRASVVSTADGGGVVELRVADGSLVTDVADLGVSVRSMTADPDAAGLTLDLPSGVDPRAVTDRLAAGGHDVAVTAVREDRRPGGAGALADEVRERLTDRQLTALRTAHAAGYYEPVRTTSGDDLADTMDISRSTFHQHLRAAERKLVGEFLGR